MIAAIEAGRWLGPAIILAGAILSRPEATPPQSPPAADETDAGVLERLEALSGQVRDLTARFVQEKHTALLRKPLVSTGAIAIKPPRVRWDTQSPHPSVMAVTPEEVRIYYPRQAVVEVYAIEDRLGPVAASPILRPSMLREHFELKVIEPPESPESPESPEPPDASDAPDASKTAARITLRLTPRHRELSEHVARITLSIDAGTGLVQRAEIVNPDDERTVLTFEDIRVNQGLTDKQLELTVPAGTTVVHPQAAPENKDGGAGNPGRRS